jgi:hypothetical protein
MDYKQYTFVGWVAIINAITTIPILVFNIALEQVARHWIGVDPILMLSMGIIILVDTFLYYKFRELLNRRYNFHETDTIILLIILGNILIGSFNIIGYMIPPILMIMKILILVSFVPFGIFFIVFAVQLLKLENDLYGFLKPYAYTTIAVGVCVATVILFVFGVLIGVAAGLMQGLIFLKSAEEVEFV